LICFCEIIPRSPTMAKLLMPELFPKLLNLGHQGLGVAGVPLIDRDGHRASAAIGQQSVIDLELVLLAVAVVTELGERTRSALEVARAQVVEHQAVLVDVARGPQLLLDRGLPLEQPIHRSVEIVLGRVGDAEILRERRGVPHQRVVASFVPGARMRADTIAVTRLASRHGREPNSAANPSRCIATLTALTAPCGAEAVTSKASPTAANDSPLSARRIISTT
jgi:hypothetical protein